MTRACWRTWAKPIKPVHIKAGQSLDSCFSLPVLQQHGNTFGKDSRWQKSSDQERVTQKKALINILLIRLLFQVRDSIGFSRHVHKQAVSHTFSPMTFKNRITVSVRSLCSSGPCFNLAALIGRELGAIGKVALGTHSSVLIMQSVFNERIHFLSCA